MIGILGGVAGVALAWLGVRALPAILPADLPRLGEIAVDGRVLFAAALVTIATVLLFGLAPSLGGAAAGRFAHLRTGRSATAGGERARGALVALEVGLALVLTVGAALMLRTLGSLTSVDPGFRTDHLLTLRLQPTGLESQDALRAYWRDIIGRVEEIPGVVGAATILHLPTTGRAWHAPIEIEGRPLAAGASPPRTAWQVVSTGWFATAGTDHPGRDRRRDVTTSPRVIAVNRPSLAHFPGEARRSGSRREHAKRNRDHRRGGAASARQLNVAPPRVYVPFGQRIVGQLAVRTVANRDRSLVRSASGR
jgi:hypothetical protein